MNSKSGSIKNWVKDRLQSTNKIQAGIAVVVIILVVGFLGITLYREWDVILSFDWTFSIPAFLLFILFHSMALATQFFAWHLIVSRLTGGKDFHSDLSIYSLSIVARRIPLPVWYIGSRLVLYKQKGISVRASSGATILETLFITIAGAICYLALLPWYSYTPEWTIWPMLLVLLSGMALIISKPGLISGMINWGIKLFKRQPLDFSLARRDLLIWIGIYLGTWFIDGLGLYFLSATILPTPPPAIDVIGISTITALIAIVSLILPSGLGIKEVTMGALYSAWIPLSAGLIVSIAYRLFQTLIELFWAIIGQNRASDTKNTPET